MKDTNIYNERYKHYNPKKMSSRQQVLYLMEKTKDGAYDPEKDVALMGKSRGSVDNVDYAQLFDQEKTRSVLLLYYYARKREELFRKHPEVLLQLANSLRCFSPIRKNKYIDKQSRKDYISEELPQSCICTLPTNVYFAYVNNLGTDHK
eukprot:TRINITY_DN14457_c0_g1_i1.p1 TRINITY_DN14457_c0_g1~~TRINITY_DN14457_c0_g1_i1.p1  ORF type:complete len:149 (+),score=33.99 TRINITY_DN14457_c0_g1_i1:163-609(+)